jgi:hypothetical protein
MKKVKIMLTLIVMLAVVGISLAFKAHNRFNSRTGDIYTIGSGTTCNTLDPTKRADVTQSTYSTRHHNFYFRGMCYYKIQNCK